MEQETTAEVGMLIRRPPAEVFGAFVSPEITTKFWFTDSSGPLEKGKHVTWRWSMYDAKTEVDVKEMEKDRRILIEWDGYKGRESVEWTFTPYNGRGTYVRVACSGFKGSREEVVEQALDSKGGFTWLLAGAKAYLEHGLELNLVADAHPKGLG